MDAHWGKLVKCSEKENEYFPILKSSHTIGRKPECDVMVADNRASGIHCVITRRGRIGGPTVKDLSSNGTLLNGKRIDKKSEVGLKDQDCITVVQEKDHTKSITYKFVDLRDSEEVEATLEYEEDATQPETLTTEEGTLRDTVSEHEDRECSVNRKRKRPYEDEVPSSVPKLRAIASEENEVLHGITEPASSSSGGGDPSVPTLVRKDSIEETLICQICQEILHDCISLQPCMHSYCGGCYSDWMGISNSCPACRKSVVRISKNHIVNNLVDAYLRAHPDKRRPQEDLKELDAKNKITEDVDYSKAKAAGRRSMDDYDDDYSSSGSTYSESSPAPYMTGTTFYPLPMPTFCLQCPGYRGFPAAAPLTSGPFTCTLATRHTMCNCCLRSMPMRDDDPAIIQKCSLCSCNFCHLYWTCTKPGCFGCLGKFQDIDLPHTSLNGILGNAYESTILKDYLDSKGWSIKDFLGVLCEQLDDGDLEVTSHGVAVSPLTVVCHICAKDLMKKLAYDYRRSIPNGQLPVAVSSRSDCYWGRECRTQYSNPSHARRYNHICEKTRPS